MKWLIACVGLLASSCVVRVTPATAPVVGPSCPGAVWVPGHFDATGKLVRAHWRCPSGNIVMAW